MSKKITYKELVEELATKTASTQTQSQEFIHQLIELLLDTSAEKGKAALTNFGNFSIVEVPERNGVSPQTGETIVIPTHKRLSFTPFKALENKVNAPFESLEATIIEDESEDKTIASTNSINSKTSFVNASNLIAVGIILIGITFGVWYFLVRDAVSNPIVAVPEIVKETPSESQSKIVEKSEIPDSSASLTTTNQTTSTENGITQEAKSTNKIDPSTTNPVVNENAPTEQIESTPIIKETFVQPSQVQTYSVTSGEWIFDIARKSYGRTTFWPLIFEANFSATDDPDRLSSMRELTIPTIENIQNPTSSDRERLAKAAQFVSVAYANAGKSEKAEDYSNVVTWFSN